MKGYEDRRVNLWKNAYKDDPTFAAGESPSAKVISFFCKRDKGVEVDISKTTEKIVDFDIVVDVKWLEFHLNRTLKYKRKWYGEQDIYKFIVLQDYVNQCISGGYKKCLLSKQEYMTIKPKNK